MKAGLRVSGKTLIAAGVVILYFLAYELWGTGNITAGHQENLAGQLERQWRSQTPDPWTLPGADATAAVNSATAGKGVFRIRIPKLELDWVVVEGVSVADLRKGPGHYTGTGYPGQTGNVVVSGHRTTYGAPFYNLDALGEGDSIQLITDRAIYHYTVMNKIVVRPTDVSVVGDKGDARLTLTTCEPRFSAKKRLVVVGSLSGSQDVRTP